MVMQSTMRAAVRDDYGDAEVIRVAQIPVPAIADDEVLIRVGAAGVDRGTWHLLTGTPYLARVAIGLRRPREVVLGRDVAGTVAKTGSKVRRFTVGDSVFGVATGSFAEYAKAKERKLAPTPDGLSAVEAAVLGISGMTALQAVDAAHLNAGSRVLVIGASGGVGSFAVQIARAVGAQVTGVCRETKVDFVRSLGAERVIAYDTVDTSDYGGPYDAIIDTGGDTPIATTSHVAHTERHARDRRRRRRRRGDRYGPTTARPILVAVRSPAAHLHCQPRAAGRPRAPRRAR